MSEVVQFVKEIQKVADKYNLFLLAGEGQQLYEKLLEREKVASKIIGSKIQNDFDYFNSNYPEHIQSHVYISKSIYYMDLNDLKGTKLDICFTKDK
jgi:hypothetical protein